MLRFVFVAATGVGLLTGFSAAARPLKEVKKSGELRTCAIIYQGMLNVEPPTCTAAKDCKKMWGPSLEIPATFAKKLGVKEVLKIYPFGDLFKDKDGKVHEGGSYTPALLEDGTCDFYSVHLTKVPWREKLVDFAILYPSRMMVVINKSNKGKIAKFEDLAGRSLATTANMSFHTWALERNKTEFKDKPIVIQTVSETDQIKEVDNGKADFALFDADGAVYGTKHHAKNSVAAFAVGNQEELGYAFAKRDKDLRAQMEAFFKDQLAESKSELNKIWMTSYGMSMTQFVNLVTQVTK